MGRNVGGRQFVVDTRSFTQAAVLEVRPADDQFSYVRLSPLPAVHVCFLFGLGETTYNVPHCCPSHNPYRQ